MSQPQTKDSETIQSCIQECQVCHNYCLEGAMNRCLETGGKHVAPEHFRLMLDCAAICQIAADFMLRGSANHAQVCNICADICEACEQSCNNLGDMEECAKACRSCADSCRQMAS